MVPSRTIRWLLGAWALILGVYGVAALTLHGQALTNFGDVVQCLIPLLANAGLLLNAGTPHWRRNVFWMLLAMACALWMIGQFQWTYYEVYLHQPLPGVFGGDIVYFLRGVPLIAAISLRPHLKRGELHLRFGYLDFVLLLTWWLFLYAYVVTPWMYASPSEGQYSYNYLLITNIQNFGVAAGFGFLSLRSKDTWKTVYAHLFGATVLYMLSSLVINVAIELPQQDPMRYHTGSFYDLPLISSFLWLGFAGAVAYLKRGQLDVAYDGAAGAESESNSSENVWAARFAMAAVVSLPLFAIYTMRFAGDPAAVRDFRLMAILIGAVPLAILVFLRTHLADADRSRLLARSEQNLENLQRLQAQLVQTEKLVSLGQLAAGAAHEINNPLTAILGFSDLLADDASLPENARRIAAKIRDQARRTKTLVGNLLSFARKVPAERTLLDINTVVTNAMQLRSLDLRSGATRIELQLESVLPGVRGDGNQLMQVFFNIINNAIDAMESANGGGVLTVRTQRDRASVVVLFSDTGPGIKEPHRVFDPFYTTKPVGKGTGLGLSICFGIIQEHNGKILCYNGQQGGAVFRVELPAALAPLPSREPQPEPASAAHKPS